MKNLGTHCYVGSLACGCGVAIVRDMPDFTKDTAKDVAGMIKSGYVVQRLPHRDACDVFAAECSAYPHEPWQKRVEEARLRRAASAPSADAVDPVDGIVTG